MTVSEWKMCKRKGAVELRRFRRGMPLDGVSVSSEDDPYNDCGYIARNPTNYANQWYVAKDYAEANYEDLPQ